MISLRAGDRERPSWAERVPPEAYWRRYVNCGGCDRSFRWREFLEHLRECPAAEEDS